MTSTTTARALRAAGYAVRPFNRVLARRVPDPRLVEVEWPLPPGRRGPVGLRAALLADLHLGPTTTVATIASAIGRVRAARPDVILLGGDYLFRDPEGAEPLGRLLAELSAPQGVYAVMGNHDHWLDAPRIGRALARAGVELLHNRGRRIATAAGSAWLGGVDDLWSGRPDLARALEGRAPGEATILLSHNPDFALQLEPGLVDLVLSGHTHGGQIRLGPLGFGNSRRGRRACAGWLTDAAADVYVSRGVGTVEVALRVGAPAEVTLVTVAPARLPARTPAPPAPR